MTMGRYLGMLVSCSRISSAIADSLMEGLACAGCMSHRREKDDGDLH